LNKNRLVFNIDASVQEKICRFNGKFFHFVELLFSAKPRFKTEKSAVLARYFFG